MKKKQVLIIATSHAEFQAYSKPYFENGWLMVPESLRVEVTSNARHAEAQGVIAVIMEKEVEE